MENTNQLTIVKINKRLPLRLVNIWCRIVSYASHQGWFEEEDEPKKDILQHIYEYDDTYKTIFSEQVLKDLIQTHFKKYCKEELLDAIKSEVFGHIYYFNTEYIYEHLLPQLKGVLDKKSIEKLKELEDEDILLRTVDKRSFFCDCVPYDGIEHFVCVGELFDVSDEIEEYITEMGFDDLYNVDEMDLDDWDHEYDVSFQNVTDDYAVA